ncbi:MAG: FMN-binding protein [Termitinemataceae bacterium]
MNQIDQIEIHDPDLNRSMDGSWTGEWNTPLVSAKVSVQTQSQRIEDIVILKHDCGMGKPAEAITGRVIAAQSLQVDCVSGATASSKVILRAIQDALEKSIAEK